MKVLILSLALVATALSEAPAPPAGWRPSGRLLLLPARLEEPTTTPAPANLTKSESERIVDSGEYYVLLEDGRLQMVKYTTAALKEKEGKAGEETKGQEAQKYQQPQQYQPGQQFQGSQQYHAAQQYQQAQAQPQGQQTAEPFAQFQVEYVQFPLPGSQFAQTKLQYTAPEADQEQQSDTDAEDAEDGYEAKVQYRDVKPISAPIYAYNPAPLVRILKK